MKTNKLNIVLLLGLISILMTSCADSASTATTIAGFWNGLWHGMTLPFAFIGSFFDPSIAIYAVSNNGHWYDFGFIIGASGTCSTVIYNEINL